MNRELPTNEYHPPTPCCKRAYPLTIAYPVYWNPYNKVVQCHSCGAMFVPCDEEPGHAYRLEIESVYGLKS